MDRGSDDSLHHLTESQAKAFILADNRLTENSPEKTACRRASKGAFAGGTGFSLEVTGFDMAEIDLRIEGLTSNRKTIRPAACASAAVGIDREPSGDLWLAGGRIGCIPQALSRKPRTRP